MLAVLITLTPGCQNEYIDSQKGKVRISVLPIMVVIRGGNSTLELLERVSWLREFPRKSLQNPKCSDYRPPSTIQNEWTIVRYVREVLKPFRYWTLWMPKRHTVTLHYVITVYNDMFDQMDGVIWDLAKKKTQWKLDLFFAVKLAPQNLSKYYSEVTPTMGMLLISAHILDSFRKLRSFRKWDKGMDIYPEDETFYTTQYQEAFLMYVENEYCAKLWGVPVNKVESIPSSNLVHNIPASGSCQSSFDRYDLSSDDEEYLTPINVAETTPGQRDRAAC